MRRYRLRLLNGTMRTMLKNTRSHPSPVLEASLQHEPCAPSSNDLVLAVKAAEQRLSAMLDDRGRIGRDLHDCILQSLYAIGLNLESVLRTSVRRELEDQESHARVREQINQLIHDVRGMIQSLEAGTVQEFDLSLELAALTSTYEQAGRLQIDLDLQPNAIDILTNEEEQEILNIVREALSNCVRHARATRATVAIRMRGSKVRVSVIDDGEGFVMANTRHGGYGFTNMHARAKKIGGTLRIQSKRGHGTQVIAEFPLEPILIPV